MQLLISSPGDKEDGETINKIRESGLWPDGAKVDLEYWSDRTFLWTYIIENEHKVASLNIIQAGAREVGEKQVCGGHPWIKKKAYKAGARYSDSEFHCHLQPSDLSYLVLWALFYLPI